MPIRENTQASANGLFDYLPLPWARGGLA